MTPTLAEILARPVRGPLLPPVSSAIVAHERRELGLSPDLEVTLVQENATRGRRRYRVFDGPKYLGSVFRADHHEKEQHDA